MRAVRATIARLCALVMASMSPVRPSENSVSGRHCASPPPAAEPLTLNVGPPLGCRIAPTTRWRSFPRPCTSPIVVVVLPSPSGVGVMAVTSMYLPSGRLASRAIARGASTLPTRPIGISSSSRRPRSRPTSRKGLMSACAASAICQSFMRVGSRTVFAIASLRRNPAPVRPAWVPQHPSICRHTPRALPCDRGALVSDTTTWQARKRWPSGHPPHGGGGGGRADRARVLACRDRAVDSRHPWPHPGRAGRRAGRIRKSRALLRAGPARCARA